MRLLQVSQTSTFTLPHSLENIHSMNTDLRTCLVTWFCPPPTTNECCLLDFLMYLVDRDERSAAEQMHPN